VYFFYIFNIYILNFILANISVCLLLRHFADSKILLQKKNERKCFFFEKKDVKNLALIKMFITFGTRYF